VAATLLPRAVRDDAAAQPLMRVLMRREEGAAAALLQHRASGRRVLAASTHLFWDPQFPDVKVRGLALQFFEKGQLGLCHPLGPGACVSEGSSCVAMSVSPPAPNSL
jgi:CCR4-NOT transcription complex subunit 6